MTLPRCRSTLVSLVIAVAITGCFRPPQAPVRPVVAPPDGPSGESVVERSSGTQTTPVAAAAPPGVAGSRGILFSDQRDRCGIDFVHHSGTPGRRYLPEAVAAGLALFDYDGDGRTDILLLGGALEPGADGRPRHTSRIYRNEGDFRFRDMTEPAGIGHLGLAMGVAAADYDEDGLPDLYVTRVGQNLLLHNEGDGTFRDVTAEADVPGAGHVGAGAAFLDADLDGRLDLYASSYVVFDPATSPERRLEGEPVFPSPLDHPPAPDKLYLNRGDGTFTDATVEAGIAEAVGRGMGVLATDHDDDGDADLLVMNDEMANFLFENDGRGRFQEVAVLRGVAFDGEGRSQGNMGVDDADVDGDGRIDFYTTTFSSEPPTLYRNAGGFYDDGTLAARAADGVVPHIKWGTAFADFDDDGLPDLYVAMGDFNEGVERWWPATRLEVRDAVLKNVGKGRFENVTATCGPGLDIVACGRGIGVDDLDGDGRVDVVVLNWRERPTILRNESPREHGWLGVRLVGSDGNRDAVGARVRVTADGRTQTAEVHAGRGYQSHHGSTLHFGLGASHVVDRIEIRWPGGTTTTQTHVLADRTVVIRQALNAQDD
jgi:hypothetical protein